MNLISLDAEQRDTIVFSIYMRICNIETGNVTMRATDAAEFNKGLASDDPRRLKIKALTTCQHQHIVYLENLVKIMKA